MGEQTQALQAVPLILLLVDEHAASTQRFKEDLISLGYDPEVIQIKSRVGLVEWLTKNRTCDVVVANHRVKDFAAADVMLVLKEMSLTVPVVLLTDGTKDEEIAPLLRLGATGFITLKEVKNLIPMIEKDMRNRKELDALKDTLAKDAQKKESAVAELEALRVKDPPKA